MTTKSSTAAPGSNAGLTPGELDALKKIAGSGAASASGAGRVYMGMVPGKATPAAKPAPLGGWMQGPPPPEVAPEGGWIQGPGPRSPGPTQRWLTEDQADAEYFNWTQKQRDDFRAKGLLSGILTQGAGDLEAYSLWQQLVKQSGLYGAQGKPVSPLDILSGYVKANSSGPKFKTTTQQSVNLTDPATARAVATKVFQDLLGRDPGQGEIAAYAAALSQSEAANPSTTTTTAQLDPATGTVVNSSSVTSGGMTPEGQQLLAEDQIKKGKEYGATQAATTYMNALLGAVGR